MLSGFQLGNFLGNLQYCILKCKNLPLERYMPAQLRIWHATDIPEKDSI